jgi:putative transcriptional regulator
MSHPVQELLLSFATGEADLPHRVLIEAHLAGCPVCRASVAEISAPGGTLLGGLPQEAPSSGLWERLRARLEPPPGPRPGQSSVPARRDETPPHLAGLPLPAAARAELPEIRELRWRWAFVRGARLAPLVRDPFTHSVLLIGYVPPRRAFPRHLHVGPEDIVLLTGGYEDEMGHYEAGEYAAYAPGTVHQPVMAPGETCWALTRLERPNRLLGWQGWAQRLLS